MPAYSEPADMLLGDLVVSDSVDLNIYTEGATNEINSRLGYIYVLPLVWGGAPGQAQGEALLKTINNKLATGRLIMSIAIGKSQEQTHAYGRSLVEEAFHDLRLLVERTLTLDADLVSGAAGPPGAMVTNQDEYSAVDAFEQEFFRNAGDTAVWRPGLRSGGS